MESNQENDAMKVVRRRLEQQRKTLMAAEREALGVGGYLRAAHLGTWLPEKERYEEDK